MVDDIHDDEMKGLCHQVKQFLYQTTEPILQVVSVCQDALEMQIHVYTLTHAYTQTLSQS